MYPERSVSDMPESFHLGACIIGSIWLQQTELRHGKSQQTISLNPSLICFSFISPGQEDPCRLLLPWALPSFLSNPSPEGLGIHFGVWDSLETFCRGADH